VANTYWIETLGCPKNEVDSSKLAARLSADGYEAADDPGAADLVVVNTCAFIESARQESVDVVLGLSESAQSGARVVVTGCMAERYGQELADALPEVDAVVGFGHELTATAVDTSTAPVQGAGRKRIEVSAAPVPAFDLLNLPRAKSSRPWAYVKVAEGCDRACGFCAIPSFRGPQRSRTIESILDEVAQLQVREVVLIAQDLAAFGRDQGVGERAIEPLVRAVAKEVDWVRLLYLYPSDLADSLIDTICSTGVPYFDLSLQHVSRPLVRRMRRWGEGAQFLERIREIRDREPSATFRSNFIVGYPGETEDDHDALLQFVEAAQLDWCGFFAFSPEAGTYAETLDGQVDTALVSERLAELGELQDAITAARRTALIGSRMRVLVDDVGVARSAGEAPEIDGIVEVPAEFEIGAFHDVTVTGATGPDLEAR
jgi:ribosomal protein S12 methylthiotransferase